MLVNTQRVRVEYKSNGRSYYNASDVLSFAKVRKGKDVYKRQECFCFSAERKIWKKEMAVLILKKMGVCQNSPQITRINTE